MARWATTGRKDGFGDGRMVIEGRLTVSCRCGRRDAIDCAVTKRGACWREVSEP
ncbi:hypothetical protein BIFGAL_03760 [Bifidobacterium gallicum DSM 20093 = LMG 11596]|uniref:Uncharacterized protein n=1 Tax=Bifidobacterium gallicum DSM 20093 = LMG 11596 TaxID=561180 RepID=D1NV77_9BIFI|nr:hypothetical protein BIFGAL_03760 [Bifidobacterium gallicum DSM 20093 = LMG 11596]